MECHLSPLFLPFELKSLKTRNRIVMAPMTRSQCPGGVPQEKIADYYARRSAGGVGLIITEGVVIDHPASLGDSGVDGLDIPNMYDPAALKGWRIVVEKVHMHGAKIFPQLWHQGGMRRNGTGPFPDALSVRPSGIWGPMDRQIYTSTAFRDASAEPTPTPKDEEIADVIAGYARSAAHAMNAGFDGIAIHGAHGYLPDTFLWEETNKRTDSWGGSRAKRTTFVVEIVKAIRREIGEDRVILFRFSQWKQQDMNGKLAGTPEQLEEVLGPIANAGVDVFDGSQGYVERPAFEGSDLNLGAWAKKVSGKAAMTIGGIGIRPGDVKSGVVRKPHDNSVIPDVSKRVELGEFDLVGVGRALLQDPNWVRKLEAGKPFEPFDERNREVLT